MLENKIQLHSHEEYEDSKSIRSLRIDSIRPNPYQPRRQFNKAALEELSESIKQYGVLQPINVRRISIGNYELVAGERRLRAATMAGLTEIPAIIININDEDSAVIALIENLQREDLSYMEEAEGYHNLIKDHGFTQEELAQKIGKSQSTIANKIRLLRLPVMVKKMLSDNDLTERHARALLKLHDEQLQLQVLKKVCERGLNVKKTEELVEKTIEKYANRNKESVSNKKLTRHIKDIRIFVNTIKEALAMMKNAGIKVRAAQINRDEYIEFIIRVPKC